MLKKKIIIAIMIILAFSAATAFTTNMNPAKAQTSNSQSPTDWSGNWDTTWGTMMLHLYTDINDAIQGDGTYTGGPWPDGTISYFTVSGNTLQGQWFSVHGTSHIIGSTGEQGFFTFTFSSDGQSFTGSYSVGAVNTGSIDGVWSGTKIASPTKHMNIDLTNVPYTDTCHLTTTVSDAETSAFIPGASLTITVTDPNGQTSTYHDTTEADGHYQFDIMWAPSDAGKTWTIYIEAIQLRNKLRTLCFTKRQTPTHRPSN